MHHCPGCGHSRWVYHRLVPFAELVEWLTGWGPYECLSCGWRGWRPSGRSRRSHKPGGAEPLPTPPVQTLQLLLQQLGGGVRHILGMAVAAVRNIQRIAAGQVRRIRGMVNALHRAPRWSLAAFTLAVVTGGLLFAGGDSVFNRTPPPATDLASSLEQVGQRVQSRQRVEPVAAVVQAAPPPVERASVPALTHVAAPAATSGQHAAVRTESSAGRVKAAAVAVATRPKAGQVKAAAVATGPSSGPVKTATQSPAGTQPRYRGSLEIHSDPSGARVSVDGRVVGSTPVVVDDLPAGSRLVRVESAGYELWSAAARVVANKQTKVSANLQRGSNQ
jgi:PEGA domain